MTDVRTRLLDRLLAPYGVSAAEVLEDEGIARGCRILEERGGLRVLAGPPLMNNTGYTPLETEEEALVRMHDKWMQFLSRAMRSRSLREQKLEHTMRPAWSILVNPVTLAAATATGIPGARLASSRLDDDKRIFPALHEGAFEEHGSTEAYVRDFSHHEASDYLQGQFLLNHADHVVRHALQLLEDTRFPIRSVSDTRFPVRSVSDTGGRHTLVEIRRLLPHSACAALAGRPLSDLFDIPGFDAGSIAGSVKILEAEPHPAKGRTNLRTERRWTNAVPAPAGTDMRWVAMTPSW